MRFILPSAVAVFFIWQDGCAHDAQEDHDPDPAGEEGRGEPITLITTYDYPSALAADRPGLTLNSVRRHGIICAGSCGGMFAGSGRGQTENRRLGDILIFTLWSCIMWSDWKPGCVLVAATREGSVDDSKHTDLDEDPEP